jgi:hypothetical protein
MTLTTPGIQARLSDLIAATPSRDLTSALTDAYVRGVTDAYRELRQCEPPTIAEDDMEDE